MNFIILFLQVWLLLSWSSEQILALCCVFHVWYIIYRI
jgi:hypothetical protein